MPFPFIVVPTYHELDNLPVFTERLWSAVPEARLLLVDDASGDGTPAWVKAHPRYNQSLFLLERAGKQGLGSAYVAGFAWVVRRHATEPCGECDSCLLRQKGFSENGLEDPLESRRAGRERH